MHIKGGYHCGCHSKSQRIRLSFWSVTSRAPIAMWPMAGRCQSSAGVNFHSVLKHSNTVRLLWQWFLDHIRTHTTTYIIKSSLQGVLYWLVLYVYLLCHCRWNKTHFGLLGLIS